MLPVERRSFGFGSILSLSHEKGAIADASPLVLQCECWPDSAIESLEPRAEAEVKRKVSAIADSGGHANGFDNGNDRKIDV